MTMNQEGVQLAVRTETSHTKDYLADWHALFDADSIAAGPWNQRMILWVNATLGTSYTRLNDALNAFAVDQGFSRWQDMNTLVLAVSQASTLLDGEDEGFAISFVDTFYQADTGFYGSAKIIDTGTPANDYDTSPDTAASSLLTYTSPSLKMTMGPDGTLRYGAHNLFLQSEALATSPWAATAVGTGVAPTATNSYAVGPNGEAATRLQFSLAGGTTTSDISQWRQTVTTLTTGATYTAKYLMRSTDGTSSYAMQITDPSGTATAITVTGEWQEFSSTGIASATFVSIGPRLRGGVTPTNADTADVLVARVHLYRIPSDSTYLKTTSAARYALPLEWDTSTPASPLGLLVEEARTQLLPYTRGTTSLALNGATAAQTATGTDGVANSAVAVTLTADANAFAYRSAFLNAAPTTVVTSSVYVKKPASGGVTTIYVAPEYAGWGGEGDETVDTGTNYITNGTFDGGSGTGWTAIGSPTISYAGNNLSYSSSSTSDYVRGEIAGLTIGKVYRVQMTMNLTTAGQGIRIAMSGDGPRFFATGSATRTIYFMARSTADTLWFRNAGGVLTEFTVDDITVHEVTNKDYSVTLTEDWQRITRTHLKGGDTTTNSLVGLTITADTESGNVFHYDHMQAEAGAFATSPIENPGTGTVTRAADNISLATTALPHSATVNSGFVEYVPKNVAAAMVALRWDDNTANEVVSIGHSAAAALGLTVTDGGVAQTAPLTSGTATANATEKVGYSWKVNDFLFSDNGAAAAADTSGTLPTVTSLAIGPTLTGYVRRLVVVPVEKTAAEVATLGTP